MKLHGPLVASLVAGALALFPAADARACGGCFHEQTQTQTTVVTGHRMAFAISPTHSVLWDQIKYSGSPNEFAWVLPVRAGAEVQISHDAWFETLEAATAAQVISPPLNCSPPSSGRGCDVGCGSAGLSANFDAPGDESSPPPVTVTHEGTVGPYETVTLHANVPNALPDWLTAHGFAIDPKVAPIVDAYTKEGFDFIALRLQPGQGVQQMKPVRVVTPGMSATLPLRMVAAGTGANVDITLFVIGEGRWETQNFPSGQLDPGNLTWDFAQQGSDYGAQRTFLLASFGGRTWNNAFAHQGSLLSQDTVNGQPAFITVAGAQYPTLAKAFAAQGVEDQDATYTAGCADAFDQFATATAKVSGDCLGTSSAGPLDGGADDGGGGDAGPPCMPPAGDIDARLFACDGLDDIAVALVGLHPQDVWLTRLEASLPRAALDTDLNLQASAQQTEVSNVFQLTHYINGPCATGGTITPESRTAARRFVIKNQLSILASVLAVLAAAVGRRRRRAPARAPFPSARPTPAVVRLR